MLKQIATVYLNMSSEPAFLSEVSKEFAQDFYDISIFWEDLKVAHEDEFDPSPGNLEKWSALVGTMATLIEQMRADDVFMDDAPDEFFDLFCVMS